MDPDLVLLLNGIVGGLLLGGLYAAAASGLAISFGMLDIVNIAHPALMVAAAFSVVVVGTWLGLDPLLVAVLQAPLFFLLGVGIYAVYHHFFERRGDEALQGLAFFFGVMFIVEVGLVMLFGPEQRFLDPPYAFVTLRLGEIDLPLRMLVLMLLAGAVIGLLLLWLRRSFTGLAIAAVAQDAEEIGRAHV